MILQTGDSAIDTGVVVAVVVGALKIVEAIASRVGIGIGGEISKLRDFRHDTGSRLAGITVLVNSMDRRLERIEEKVDRK